MRFEYDFENAVEESEDDAAWSKSPEELMDRFGIRTALLVICISCFIAAIWLVSRPSFEKCSALESVTERNACFETLRNDLLKPPAKGADIPRVSIRLTISVIRLPYRSLDGDRVHADKLREST